MYRRLNANHEVMQSPYLRAMLALTLIKGPLVDDWASNQVQALEEKVTRTIAPISQDQEVLWTDFVTVFDSNYTDITKKQQALSALYQLCMQKDCFDNYITTFKHYAKQAEFDLTHLATIQLFAIGIENKLQDAILHRDTQPDTIEGYITAAQAKIQKYQNQQAIKFPGHAKFLWIGGQQPLMPWNFQPQYQPRNMAYQRPVHRNDQAIFMDIDKLGEVFAQI